MIGLNYQFLTTSISKLLTAVGLRAAQEHTGQESVVSDLLAGLDKLDSERRVKLTSDFDCTDVLVTGTFSKETVSFNKGSSIVPHFSSFEAPEPALYKPVVQDSTKNNTQIIAYIPPLHTRLAVPFFVRLFSLGLGAFGLSSLFNDIVSRLFVGSSTDGSSPTSSKNSKNCSHVTPLDPDLPGDNGASRPSINTSTAPEMTIGHGSWDHQVTISLYAEFKRDYTENQKMLSAYHSKYDTPGDSGFWEDESAWEDEIEEESEDEMTMTRERFNRILHKHEVVGECLCMKW